MHAISLKCATSNASTLVSVYFDSWALNRLFLSETSGHNDELVIPCTVSVWVPFDRLLPISIPIKMLFTLKYTFYKKYQPSLQKVPLPDGFPSATTRAWPSTTNHEVPSIYMSGRTSEMTGLFPPGRQAQVQTSSLLRLQSETVNCKKEPIYNECWECFSVIRTIPPALVHVPFSHFPPLWSGSTWLILLSDPFCGGAVAQR